MHRRPDTSTDQGVLALDLEKHIIAATTNVFQTMVMMDVDPAPPRDQPIRSFEQTISGMLGLSGDLQGTLNIHFPYTAAKLITGNLLGMPVESIDADVRDAIGEIANMVAGGLKIGLASYNLNVNLSTPTTIAGDSFTINRISKAEGITIPFHVAGERILVDFQYILPR
jgi:chemotaxis protein CheX